MAGLIPFRTGKVLFWSEQNGHGIISVSGSTQELRIGLEDIKPRYGALISNSRLEFKYSEDEGRFQEFWVHKDDPFVA